MIENKQDDLIESIYTYFKVRNCYTCSYYYQKDNKCNKGHKHLTKLKCKQHKFKQ